MDTPMSVIGDEETVQDTTTLPDVQESPVVANEPVAVTPFASDIERKRQERTQQLETNRSLFQQNMKVAYELQQKPVASDIANSSTWNNPYARDYLVNTGQMPAQKMTDSFFGHLGRGLARGALGTLGGIVNTLAKTTETFTGYEVLDPVSNWFNDKTQRLEKHWQGEQGWGMGAVTERAGEFLPFIASLVAGGAALRGAGVISKALTSANAIDNFNIAY
jgi:hypothetical protein